MFPPSKISAESSIPDSESWHVETGCSGADGGQGASVDGGSVVAAMTGEEGEEEAGEGAGGSGHTTPGMVPHLTNAPATCLTLPRLFDEQLLVFLFLV